ncbi:hypothetical protein KCN56_02755 [Photobacterium galatheae]|uniref:hypothetical protein n=1 Tax=Photobacterium galatheae TaxID=1654360 RepID=UPI00202CF93A|nr:hypothetical protein [Photobacterium galatheae]MCM0147490.1 hypothetical protein [Photobacterium galatheae]
MKRQSVFLLWLLMPIFLSACSQTRHNQLAELGFARNYLDGYQDGCDSRKIQATTFINGFRQDPERMKKENKYANGWNDGYEQCYASNQDYH